MKEFEDFALPPGLRWPIPHTADDKALRLSTREFLKAILTKRFPQLSPDRQHLMGFKGSSELRLDLDQLSVPLRQPACRHPFNYK